MPKNTKAKTTSDVNSLTELEQFYLEGHRNTSLSTLAKTLGKPVAVVKAALKTLPAVEIPPDNGVVPTGDNRTIMRKLTTPRKEDGTKRGVAVMSAAASEVADAGRGKNITPKKFNDCVMKIDES